MQPGVKSTAITSNYQQSQPHLLKAWQQKHIQAVIYATRRKNYSFYQQSPAITTSSAQGMAARKQPGCYTCKQALQLQA
jgi:hypothetical protein